MVEGETKGWDMGMKRWREREGGCRFIGRNEEMTLKIEFETL